MLSQADKDLIARETALPGLGLVLDRAALARRLSLPPLRALYLRYKPETCCIAAFAPEGDGLAAFCAMAVTSERFAELRARPEWQGGADPVRFDAEACLALVPLLRDRDLKGARRLADPECGADFLNKLTGASGPVDLLRYKPGRRFVLRHGDALVKAYTRPDFEARLAAARLAERLGGAPLRGVSERHRCIAWSWLDGQSLCPESTGEAPRAEDWEITGAALAGVHRHPKHLPSTVDRAAEVAEVEAHLAAFGALCPTLAQAATAPARTLIERLKASTFEPTLIHGDFSADQVLVRSGKARIIDWDRATTGDPARDIGSALACLDVQVIDGVIAEHHRDRAVAAFLRGYASPLSPEALALQHARALIALTAGGFRDRRVDWLDRGMRILGRASQVLGQTSDPAMPGLGMALDTETMQPLTNAAAGTTAEILSVELIRHKPGRRALIRYRLAETPPLLGKIRAKGLDKATPALHTQLRAKGLDGRSPGHVGVPRARDLVKAASLWLQEEVPGRPLTECLAPGANPKPLEQAGRALARLHSAGTPAKRVWTMNEELGVLLKNLKGAEVKRPQDAPRLRAIADAARSAIHAFPPAETTGIHRDFYLDQLLVDGRCVWLLDLDLYAEGDPAIDLGNFLAHLDEHALRHHGRLDVLNPLGAAFLSGYAALRPLDRPRVEVMRRVSLARHINLSLVIADRGHTTAPLIDHCTDLFLSYQHQRSYTSGTHPMI